MKSKTAQNATVIAESSIGFKGWPDPIEGS